MNILSWRRGTRGRGAPVAAPGGAEGRGGEAGGIPGAFEASGIGTSCGGTWRVRDADGIVGHGGPVGDGPDATLLLLRFLRRPHLGLLVASWPGARPIGIRGDELAAPVLSVVVRDLDDAGRIALRHPLRELHACSLPPAAEPGGIVRIDRAPVGGWEMHAPTALADPPVLSAELSAALDSAVAPLEAGLDPSAMADWLRAAPTAILRAIGPALLRLARPDALAALGVAIAAEPPLALRLAAAWGRDDPLALALPNLAAWRVARTPRARVGIGPEADALADPAGDPAGNGAAVRGPDGLRDGVVSRLVRGARAEVAARADLALVAAVGNRGALLLDWVAHHRALGIAHLFLYSAEDDGADALLARLSGHGMLSWLSVGRAPPVPLGRLAIAHARSCLPDLLVARWSAGLELDEFLVEDRPGALASRLELAERRGADRMRLPLGAEEPRVSADPGAPEVVRTGPLPGGPVRDDEAGAVAVLRRVARSLPEPARAAIADMADATPFQGEAEPHRAALRWFLAAIDPESAPRATDARFLGERERLLRLPGVREAHREALELSGRRAEAAMRALPAHDPAGRSGGIDAGALAALRALLHAARTDASGGDRASEDLPDRAGQRA